MNTSERSSATSATSATGWARVDRYLTSDRLVVYPAAVVILFVVVWVISLPLAFPLPDFLSRWTAGRLVLDGRAADLYDPAVQSVLQADLGSDALSWFVSPPYVAALLAPVGAMPYAVAAGLWTVATLGLLWLAVRSLVALHPAFSALDGWRGLLIAGSCQAVLELVGAGQDTALVLAAFALGARLLADGRDPLAGMVLSLALVKPQLAWLVPLVLITRGAWRALGGFVLGGIALLALSLLVTGPRSWLRWVDAITSPLYRNEVVAAQTSKNATIHGLLEHLVPGAGWPATALWAVGFVILATLAVRHRGRLADVSLPVLLVTAVPLTTVLLTPHAMVYDLVVVLPAVVWLIATHPSPRVRGLAAVGYVLLFLSPLLQIATGLVPALAALAAPWVVLVLVLLWRELGGVVAPTPSEVTPEVSGGSLNAS